ncbi:MAG TPA: metallophosphoesterase [Nocardioides sp.]|nr:metallophosphoesterase [Nocardioides sp.]
MSRRIAVIGDVGGHLEALRAELSRIGVPDDGAGEIPEDLVVVQVGDLVHRGPDSAGVVALVDTHLRRTPDRWFQLVGNHEAFYVFGPQFRLSERLDRRAAGTLSGWWQEGVLRAAVSFSSGGETFLVTHAGLTREYWRLFLGAPDDARAAAAALNDMLRRGDDRLIRAGQVHGGAVDPAAGPLWAAADTELEAGWRDHTLPFSQVHGHSSAVRWPDGDAPEPPASDVVLDHTLRHTTTVLAGGRIIGVDPGHGDNAAESWGALELPLDVP